MISTLHTNDAPSAVVRLSDLGVDHFKIAGALIGSIAQRLLRRLCPDCKEPAPPKQEMLDRMGIARERVSDAVFYRSAVVPNAWGPDMSDACRSSKSCWCKTKLPMPSNAEPPSRSCERSLAETGCATCRKRDWPKLWRDTRRSKKSTLNRWVEPAHEKHSLGHANSLCFPGDASHTPRTGPKRMVASTLSHVEARFARFADDAFDAA